MILMMNSLQKIIELNESTFYDYIPHTNQTNMTLEQPTMLKFWASYCGHCKRLAPKYENISNKEENQHILFTAIECTEPQQKLICSEQGIDGFPTLYLYDKNGARHVYHGQMEEINIQLFIDSFASALFKRNYTDEKLLQESKQYEFDHYYKLQVQNCSAYEQLLESTRGSAIIACDDGFQNDTMIVVKENGNIFNQTITYENGHNGTQDMLHFFFFHEEPMFQKLDPYNFEELIKCGGVLVVYGDQEELANETEFLRQQSEMINATYHYGYLPRKGAGQGLVEEQLKLDPENNYIIFFFLTKDKRLKVSAKQYNQETDNFQELYYDIYNNRMNYTITIAEEQQQQQKEEHQEQQQTKKQNQIIQFMKQQGFIKLYIAISTTLMFLFMILMKCCGFKQQCQCQNKFKNIEEQEESDEQEQDLKGEQLIDEQVKPDNSKQDKQE